MAKYGKYKGAELLTKEEIEQLDNPEEIMAALEAIRQKNSITKFVVLLVIVVVVIFVLVLGMILALHYGSNYFLG